MSNKKKQKKVAKIAILGATGGVAVGAAIGLGIFYHNKNNRVVSIDTNVINVTPLVESADVAISFDNESGRIKENDQIIVSYREINSEKIETDLFTIKFNEKEKIFYASKTIVGLKEAANYEITSLSLKKSDLENEPDRKVRFNVPNPEKTFFSADPHYDIVNFKHEIMPDINGTNVSISANIISKGRKYYNKDIRVIYSYDNGRKTIISSSDVYKGDDVPLNLQFSNLFRNKEYKFNKIQYKFNSQWIDATFNTNIESIKKDKFSIVKQDAEKGELKFEASDEYPTKGKIEITIPNFSETSLTPKNEIILKLENNRDNKILEIPAKIEASGLIVANSDNFLTSTKYKVVEIISSKKAEDLEVINIPAPDSEFLTPKGKQTINIENLFIDENNKINGSAIVETIGNDLEGKEISILFEIVDSTTGEIIPKNTPIKINMPYISSEEKINFISGEEVISNRKYVPTEISVVNDNDLKINKKYNNDNKPFVITPEKDIKVTQVTITRDSNKDGYKNVNLEIKFDNDHQDLKVDDNVFVTILEKNGDKKFTFQGVVQEESQTKELKALISVENLKPNTEYSISEIYSNSKHPEMVKNHKFTFIPNNFITDKEHFKLESISSVDESITAETNEKSIFASFNVYSDQLNDKKIRLIYEYLDIDGNMKNIFSSWEKWEETHEQKFTFLDKNENKNPEIIPHNRTFKLKDIEVANIDNSALSEEIKFENVDNDEIIEKGIFSKLPFSIEKFEIVESSSTTNSISLKMAIEDKNLPSKLFNHRSNISLQYKKVKDTNSGYAIAEINKNSISYDLENKKIYLEINIDNLDSGTEYQFASFLYKKNEADYTSIEFNYSLSNSDDSPMDGTTVLTIPEKSLLEPTSNINSFNNLEINIIGDVERKIQDEYYETELVKKYGNDFKYPGWNYNYEKKENEKLVNRNITLQGEEVDLAKLVWEESTEFVNEKNETIKAKYRDPEFILNEIKNNKLKKHPASKVFFEQEITSNVPAIEKAFSLPSAVKGISSLGLYAAPGEIVTLEMKSETIEVMKKQKINNFQIIINSGYWDNRGPEKSDSGETSNRYPFITTTFNISIDELVKNGGIFKFGSPFGGTISAFINTQIEKENNLFYKNFGNYEFSVKGALEMLSYYHNITTKEDWDQQIQKIKDGKIVAPGMSIDFSYGSMNIGSTGINQFAYKKIDEIIYPFEVVEKWTSFLFLSEYFGSRDLNNNVKKIRFNFCDDVWGGAGAWGGGDTLWAPLNWAKDSFLSGNESWFIRNNWGTFHEINHNFQQDSALFKLKSHGKTNQVNMLDLSLISDAGRYRNLFNPAAEFVFNSWTLLQNPFSTIAEIIKNNYGPTKQEYSQQNLLLYFLGSYNLLNYIRQDVVNNPNTGNLEEIEELSNYFKLNFWPVYSNFYPIWHDTDLPSSYEAATEEQKKRIDELKKFKAFDFVGNLYATGTYLYDQNSNSMKYTNDTQAAIDIPAGREYVLDFEKGINSVNKNFSWSELKFDSRTKLGGELKIDPSNSKKLIYTPNKESISEVDEFDLSIIPNDFIGKSENYVPEYRWKIKLRQAVNMPIVSVYKNPIAENETDQFYKEFDYLKDEQNIEFSTSSDPRLGFLYNIKTHELQDKKWQKNKISFNFIAPETGQYDFKARLDGQIFIVNKNEGDGIWWKWQGYRAPIRENFQNVKSVTLQKGDIIPFEIYTTNAVSFTRLNFVANINGKTIDAFDYALVPWVKELTNDPSEYLDSKYNYVPRTINYNDFQTSLFGVNAPRDEKTIKRIGENGEKNYSFENIYPVNSDASKTIDNKLAEKDGYFFEYWGTAPYTSRFKVKFSKPEDVGTIFFYHRTNNWRNGRPVSIIVKDDKQNVIYKGKYGEQFNDRTRDRSILILDKIYKVEELTFEFVNDMILQGGDKSTIIFDTIRFSSTSPILSNKMYPIQSKGIDLYGSWEVIKNNSGENISDLNASSIKTDYKGDYIEFEMFAQGFDLIGQKDLNNSSFDIFINDKLVETISTTSDSRKDNQILYSFTSEQKDGELIKVKIVNKENKNLFLNYLQTYGKETYIKEK